MSVVYILGSPKLSVWANRQGLGESVVKIGYTTAPVRVRVLELKVGEYGGVKDWRLVEGNTFATEFPESLEHEIHTHLRQNGKWLDPTRHRNLVDEYGVPSTELFVIEDTEATQLVLSIRERLTLERTSRGYRLGRLIRGLLRSKAFWLFVLVASMIIAALHFFPYSIQ